MKIGVDMALLVTCQISVRNRFPIFDDDMLFAHFRELTLEDRSRVVEGDRDDLAAGALGDLEAAAMEITEFRLVSAFVARSFRKDEDGNPIVDVIDGLVNRLKTLLQVFPLQEKTEQEPHVPRQNRNMCEIVFRHVSAPGLHLAVADDDIEETLVIADEENGFICRNIFQTLDRDGRACDEEEDSERTLYDMQHRHLSCEGPFLPDQCFHKKNRDGNDTVKNDKQDSEDGSNHDFSFLTVSLGRLLFTD